MAIRHTTINGNSKVWLARVAYQGRRRSLPLGAAIATMLLALTVPVSGEMPAQSWLDFYNGNSRTVPISVARVLASTYTLGMADGLISTQIVSCPAGYIPAAEVIREMWAAARTIVPQLFPLEQAEARVAAALAAAVSAREPLLSR